MFDSPDDGIDGAGEIQIEFLGGFFIAEDLILEQIFLKMLFNHDPFLLFISFFLIELDFSQSFYDLILRVFAVPVDSLAVVNDRDVES